MYLLLELLVYRGQHIIHTNPESGCGSRTRGNVESHGEVDV